jgi:predicted dehydrogenase
VSLRLGFVGCGKWARKLKSAFEAEGCTVVAHARSKEPRLAFGRVDEPGFGRHVIWQDMVISSPSLEVDALVLCAPPEVTTEIALVCAAAGKPVMATKPLMLEEAPPIQAPFYVDFWRLWSKTWQRMSHYAEGENRSRDLSITMIGAGPYRSFPGLLDYGPHALAFIHALGQAWPSAPRVREAAVIQIDGAGGEVVSAKLVSCMNTHKLLAGNGWQSAPCRGASLDTGATGTLQWAEEPERTSLWGPSSDGQFIQLLEEPKKEAIQRMCLNFLSDIKQGLVEKQYLELSCRVMQDLRAIRELVQQPKP